MRSTRSASPTARWRGRSGSGSSIDDPALASVPARVHSDEPARASPTRRDPDRETVDLLFFPTGGGKTEAYLGLAAFAIVLRRLRHPGEKGALAPA